MSLRLSLLAALLALAPAGAASAASLSISVASGPMTAVDYSGTADAPGSVGVFGFRVDAPTCPPHDQVIRGTVRPEWSSGDNPVGSAGAFSGRATGPALQPGRWLMCGYLRDSQSAVATAQAVVDQPEASAGGPADPAENGGSDSAGGLAANGNNMLDLTRGNFVVNRWAVMAEGARGTGTITVSPATRAKLRLPSAVIAKGRIYKNGPEGSYAIDFKSTRAIVKRLRTARTVPVTFALDLSGPMDKVVTAKITMLLLRPGQDTPNGLVRKLLAWDATGAPVERHWDGEY